MQNYKPGQSVRVITLHIAVDAEEAGDYVADEISAMLSNAMVSDDTAIVDWQYADYRVWKDSEPYLPGPVTTVSDDPEEGEAFTNLGL